jgi:hypothetical protein
MKKPKTENELPGYIKKIPPEHLYIESSGLPFSDVTRHTLDRLKDRVDRGLASCIVIDGAMGSGKTTFAVQMADYIQGDFIDLQKQLSLGGKEFFKKADVVVRDKLKVLIYDEAGDFDRRGALGQFNKMLNRFFQTYRAYKIIVIVVLPNFKILDNRLFDNQVPRVLFHMTKKAKTYAEYKAYSLRRMFWLLNAFKKFNDPLTAYKLTDHNYRGKVKDLPASRCAALDKLSTAGKKEIIRESRVKLEGMVNRKTIARAFNKTLSWVANRLVLYDVKPVHKMGRTEFYGQEVIDIIRKEEKARAGAIK